MKGKGGGGGGGKTFIDKEGGERRHRSVNVERDRKVVGGYLISQNVLRGVHRKEIGYQRHVINLGGSVRERRRIPGAGKQVVVSASEGLKRGGEVLQEEKVSRRHGRHVGGGKKNNRLCEKGGGGGGISRS